MSVEIDTTAGELRKRRSLFANSGSTGITIPPEVLDQADLDAGDEVEIAVAFDSDTIELRPTRAENEAEE